MNRYDKEFKEESVRFSDEIDPRKAAEQLGVAYYTLQGWRKQRVLHGDGAHIDSEHAYASADKTAREIEFEKEIGISIRIVSDSNPVPGCIPTPGPLVGQKRAVHEIERHELRIDQPSND